MQATIGNVRRENGSRHGHSSPSALATGSKVDNETRLAHKIPDIPSGARCIALVGPYQSGKISWVSRG